MLTDLGQQLSQQAAEFEQQKLLLESTQRESAGLPPGSMTLVEAMEAHRAATEEAEAERIAAAKQAARLEAEKQQTERVAKLERELIETRTKREEDRILAEKAREEQLAKLEQEQIAEEARVEEARRKATIADLQEEVTRVEEALRWAQLDREMARDMEQIRGYLAAFITPGYKKRDDDLKGPMSFALIKGGGALEGTQSGMTVLHVLASHLNDRPRGPLPEYFGGSTTDWSRVNPAPIQKAQELLSKYGDLMVRKGMLAP